MVGLGYLLELVLGARVAVFVRVILEGHLAIGLLDVVRTGRPTDSEYGIVVLAHG